MKIAKQNLQEDVRNLILYLRLVSHFLNCAIERFFRLQFNQRGRLNGGKPQLHRQGRVRSQRVIAGVLEPTGIGQSQ